jgi:diamine N-acetyltransferase
MFLKGKLVYLRALEPEDSDILYDWENNMALWPVSFTQVPFSRFVLDEFANAAHQDIYTNKQLRLIICETGSGNPAGIIDLFEFDPQHDRCGVGIYIEEHSRHKGYAAESVALIRHYCFTVLHLRQMFVHVNAANEASISLFEKAGFIKSGLKKDWHKIGLNHYEDVWFLQCFNAGIQA